MFKILKAQNKIFTSTTVVCFATAVVYLWNDISKSHIFALENDLEEKKLKCKKLVKRFKVSLVLTQLSKA